MNSNAELDAIAQLDLDPIKVKLMHKESGEGWTRAQADAVEFEYRRFLSLMKLFPEEQVAPRFDVDIFWHYHILDTMKYAADCEHIFGYFLHHFPYTGLLGDEDDDAVHRQVGERMQELYEATFGDAFNGQNEVRAALPTTAYSQPVMLKTAYSQPITMKTAYSQPVVAKTAYSQPVVAKTAYSQPVMAKTAYSQPMAQNDQFYSVRPSLEPAKTAYSQPLAQKNSRYVRPKLGTSNNAVSSPSVARNDSTYALRPVFAEAA